MTDNRIIQFNNSDEKLLEIAENRHDDGDLEGALSTLISLENSGSKMIEVLSEIADVYMDLGLYNHSAKYWFKYLSVCPKSKQPKAFNALGACYYFLGDYSISGYYFERQVAEANDKEFEYDDIMMSYYENICEITKPEFYICYPFENVAASKLIADGDKMFLAKKFDEAIKLFSSVKEQDPLYDEAQTKIAACLFCKNEHENAIMAFDKVIARDTTNKQAILNMLGMLYTVGFGDRAQYYFDLAEKLDFNDCEECYKLAAAYCDAMNDEKASFYLKKAIGYDCYDVNSLFLYGLVCYNLKQFDDAEKSFSSCYKITFSPVAKYYILLSRETCENIKQFSRLDYVFNVPKEEIKRRVEYIQLVLKNGEKSIAKADKKKLIEIAEWVFCFDSKAQEPFCEVLLSSSNIQIRKFFIAQLLNPVIGDDVKTVIISKLVEKGYDKKIGVVFGNIFNKIQLLKAEFDKEKNDIFNLAFSLAFAKIAPIDSEKSYKIRDGAYELYYELKENGNLKKIADKNALAATMIIYSGLKIASKRSMIASYFYTDKDKIKQIIELAKEQK